METSVEQALAANVRRLRSLRHSLLLSSEPYIIQTELDEKNAGENMTH